MSVKEGWIKKDDHVSRFTLLESQPRFIQVPEVEKKVFFFFF